MASYDVIVKLVDQTKGSMKNIESGLKGIQSAASRAQAVLAGMVSGQVVKQLYATGTAIEAIEKRLKFITPAGTDTKALFKDLSGLASSLGADVYDMSNAFITLRNNGLAPTEDRLTAIANIAKVSGASINDVADALGNVGDAEKLKALERATGDLIKIDEVLNAYGVSTGKFAIKYAGETVKIVSSSAEAVKAIENIGNTQLKGAASESARTLSGSFGELKNKIIEATNALLEGGLKDALIDIADKAILAINANKDLIKVFGGDLGRAITIAADALKILADNFSLIKDVVITLLIVKLGSALLNLSSAITNNRGPIAAFIRGLFGIGTAAAAAGTGIAAISTAAAVGPITAFATRMGLLFATLGGFTGIITSIGAALLAFISSPITLTVAALVGIELAMRKAFDISPIDMLAAKLESLVTNNFPRVAKFLNDTGKFLGMAPAPSVANAPAAPYKDPRILGNPGTIAEQAAAMSKPSANINAAAGGDTAPDKKLSTTLDALGDLNKKIFDANNAIRVLEPALGKALASGDVVRYNQVWEALKGNYETIGRDVLPNLGIAGKQARKELDFDLLTKAQELAIYKGQLTDTVLQAKIFASELAQSAAELDKNAIRLKDTVNITEKFRQELVATQQSIVEQGLRLADLGLMTKKFSLELQTSQQALTEQQMKLDDASFMTEKFKQEVTGAGQSLVEAALKLKDVNYQTATFGNNLISTRQAVEQQRITLGQLNKGFADGTVSLLEYSTALGQLDAALLTSTQVLDQALGAAGREAAITRTRATALEELNARFRSGAVDAKAYRIAASNLGGDTDAIDRTVNVYGTARDQIIEDNEFIKKSIGSAAKTFSDEFTGAIMKGQLSFSSFKNFLTNILNDIAQRIIKRQFADPIADYMTNMASQVFGKGGVIPTKAGEGAVTASDSMTTIFQGLAGKTSNIFSSMSSGISEIFGGMGSSLMSSMSGIFDWIMNGIGSIGSSMGGMGSSLSGLFSGGGGGDLLGSVAGFFSGFFADGGTLGAGQYGIAGEAGPEMISGPATITPMTQDAQEPLIVNFNLNALDTQSGTEFLIKNKAVISKVIEDAYNRRGKRGPITA